MQPRIITIILIQALINNRKKLTLISKTYVIHELRADILCRECMGECERSVRAVRVNGAIDETGHVWCEYEDFERSDCAVRVDGAIGQRV